MILFSSHRTLSVYATSIALGSLFFIASCSKDKDSQEAPPSSNAPAEHTAAGGIDQEGDAFTSVIIGSQEWMSENLSVATYRDGTPIPKVTNPNEWWNLTTGAWCWFNNDSATYAATYGRLYNWYAVAGVYDAASEANPALRKQLAPEGWHVPTDAEWTSLINYLGGESLAGGKMKTTGTIEEGTGLWNSPNYGATNSSGFSGKPGGRRLGLGDFIVLGVDGYWWSSSEFDNGFAWHRYLDNNFGTVFRYYDGVKRDGLSVRCLRD